MKTTELVKTTAKDIHLHTNQSYQESKIEAEEILMHVLGINKSRIYSNIFIDITKDDLELFNYIVSKKKK